MKFPQFLLFDKFINILYEDFDLLKNSGNNPEYVSSSTKHRWLSCVNWNRLDDELQKLEYYKRSRPVKIQSYQYHFTGNYAKLEY